MCFNREFIFFDFVREWLCIYFFALRYYLLIYLNISDRSGDFLHNKKSIYGFLCFNTVCVFFLTQMITWHVSLKAIVTSQMET
jgi:hypothetical protein